MHGDFIVTGALQRVELVRLPARPGMLPALLVGGPPLQVSIPPIRLRPAPSSEFRALVRGARCGHYAFPLFPSTFSPGFDAWR